VRFLLTGAWVLCIVYATIPAFWLMIHPFAERLRTGKRVIARMSMLWLVIIIAVALATRQWRDLRFYTTPWAWLGWLAFVLTAIRIYRAMRKNFSGDQLIGRDEVEANRQPRLVTTGIHGRMRHPIYLAHLLMLTGWAFGTGLVVIWGLWGFAILTGIFLIRTEDAELERRFGDEYREYKRRVPAIFPRI
jgi:protein-S-isoprenylcysteine O-methyltransferase Ste14